MNLCEFKPCLHTTFQANPDSIVKPFLKKGLRVEIFIVLSLSTEISVESPWGSLPLLTTVGYSFWDRNQPRKSSGERAKSLMTISFNPLHQDMPERIFSSIQIQKEPSTHWSWFEFCFYCMLPKCFHIWQIVISVTSSSVFSWSLRGSCSIVRAISQCWKRTSGLPLASVESFQ